ncbi:hypothetical protein PINS_up021013 [Pythium insidiosum]|nr:hypothetical protein PINS_up021013 [Pythium insidiosum]
MASGGNVTAVASMVFKNLGDGNIPANEVTLHPDCKQVDLAVAPVGVRVSCRDAGTPLVPFSAPVGGYMHVYNRRGSTVHIGVLDHFVLQFLVFANGDDYIARAQMAFDDNSFVALEALKALVFDNVNFVKPRVAISVPNNLKRLEIPSTNALSVSLKIANDNLSQLNEFNFRDVQFTTLPPVLYERRYSKPLSINKLSINPDTDVLKLDTVSYDNAVANLNATTLPNVHFVGDCSAKFKTDSGLLSVCRSSELLTAGSSGGAGAGAGTPVVAPTGATSKAPTPSPTTSSGSVSVGVVVLLVLVSALALAAVAFVVRRRQQSKQPATATNTQEPSTLGDGDDDDDTSTCTSPTSTVDLAAHRDALEQAGLERLRIPAADLTVGGEISQGAFGRVYRGSYQGERVAIKRLAPHRRKDLKQFLAFVDEAKLMASMRHARIIRFVGIAWSSPLDLHVVTEYMDGGDLRVLLAQYHEQRRPTGFSRDKLKIALHVAEGLAYMHALRPQVLHRDLKSRNVLLTSSLDAKLIDFGVARERADHTMTTGVGTLRWMAPEVMAGGHYGESADVFSLGVILSELDTHELPYCGADGAPMRDEAIIARVSMGTLSVRFSAHADAAVVALARECMALTPSDRPSAARVAEQLEVLLRAAS